MLPSSIVTFDNSIADNEYHPKPEDIAIFFIKDNDVKKEAKYPPKRVPIIVDSGNSQILKPNLLIFFKDEFEDPISIPTKKRSSDKPILMKLFEYFKRKGCLKKMPKKIPKDIEKNILII